MPVPALIHLTSTRAVLGGAPSLLLGFDEGRQWARCGGVVARILGPSLTHYARELFTTYALPEVIIAAIVVIACIAVAQLIRGS